MTVTVDLSTTSRKARPARSSISTCCSPIRTRRPRRCIITFLKDDGTHGRADADAGGRTSRTTIHVDDDPRTGRRGILDDRHVDRRRCRSSSSAPCGGTRRGYGAHTEKAARAPATTWYFAEGSQGFFLTYLLLANPQAVAESRDGHVPARGRDAGARATTPLRRPRRAAPSTPARDAELVNQSFGMDRDVRRCPASPSARCTSATTPLWNGGHESAGVTQPSTQLVPRGRRDRLVLRYVRPVRNPNADAARRHGDVTCPSTGAPIDEDVRRLPAEQRLTINIEIEDPALANAAVATQVDVDGADHRRARAVLAGSGADGTKRTTASA